MLRVWGIGFQGVGWSSAAEAPGYKKAAFRGLQYQPGHISVHIYNEQLDFKVLGIKVLRA